MKADGTRRAAVFATSAWGGYSQPNTRGHHPRPGAVEGVPELIKLRQFFDHPLFLGMFADAITKAAATLPESVRAEARLVFTAHPFRCGRRIDAVRTSTAARSVMPRNWSRRRPHRLRSSGSRARVPPRFRGWNPMPLSIFRVCPTQVSKWVIVCPLGFVADHIEVVISTTN